DVEPSTARIDERGEGMDADEERLDAARHPAGELLVDLRVIGGVDARDAPASLARRHPGIERQRYPLRLGTYERGIDGIPVEIDHEAAETATDGGRVEVARDDLHDFPRPDVPA